LNRQLSPGEQLLESVARDPDLAAVGEAAPEAQQVFLIFRVGPHWYAVPAQGVGEVVPYSRPVPIPGVPTVIAGVVNLTGRIVAVLDLSVLLGAGRAGAQEATRCVLLQAGGLPVAIVPDEIGGLASVPRSAMQAAAEVDGLAGETFTEGGRLVTVLSPEKLLARAEAQVDGAGGGGAWSS
jgi:purine-binding chemotaxis protein CheW